MFEQILQKNEKVLWSDGVNKTSYIIKKASKGVLASVIAAFFLGSFATMPVAMMSEHLESDEYFSKLVIAILIIFIIGSLISILRAYLNSKNTYFAITNKRIILRSGAFNLRFIHYSLKNVGNVEVVGSLFDSKGEEASANLVISTKDFHLNTDGNKAPKYLVVTSLRNAFKAYNVLAEKTEGYNEVLRIKNEE